MTFRRSLAALLLVAACGPDPRDGGDRDPGPTPTVPQPVDADGDGWSTPEDCDDADPAVHPGVAHDKPYDGRDLDCAGDDDDVDGDGFRARVVGGDDCDDYDASVPGDADGDGYRCADDCDETNAAIHAGATPICGDGIDDDCDGIDDCGLHGLHDIDDLADIHWTSSAMGGHLYRLTVAEVSGDGTNDLLLRHFGKQVNLLQFYVGPLSPTLTDGDHVTELWAPNMEDHAVGDYNHDGQLDVIATSNWRADVVEGHLWFGPLAVGAPDPDAHVLDYLTGYPVPFTCDVNHDGGDDLVMGWRDGSGFELPTPTVQLIHGPITGDVPNEGVDASLYSVDGDEIGGLLRCADFDGDGLQDIVTGGTYGDPLWVVAGVDLPTSTDVAVESVGLELTADAYFVSEAHDWNGDGHADLGWAENGFYFYEGPLSGGAPMARFLAAGENPAQVTSPGDVDGDGIDDVAAVVMNYDDLGYDTGGALLLLLSPIQGVLTEEDVEAIVVDDLGGAEAFDFGLSFFGPRADVNQDGFDDLILGTPFTPGVNGSFGNGYVLFGETWGF